MSDNFEEPRVDADTLERLRQRQRQKANILKTLYPSDSAPEQDYATFSVPGRAPEHALQCLRDFISMAETLQQMAAAAAVPPESPAMPGAPMPGGPLPPAMPPEMGIAS